MAVYFTGLAAQDFKELPVFHIFVQNSRTIYCHYATQGQKNTAVARFLHERHMTNNRQHNNSLGNMADMLTRQHQGNTVRHIDLTKFEQQASVMESTALSYSVVVPTSVHHHSSFQNG